jgi:mannose-6-phosphate isomerase-like protein (cupin superfamily)
VTHTNASSDSRLPLVLAPGEGRSYNLGRGAAIFKADGDETAGRYSISEWWLDPHTKGPGAHTHPEDDVFFVLEGTMSVFVHDEWVGAPAGSFVLVPGGFTHTFENRGDTRAGALNISAPGDFETRMPGIAQWFVDRLPEEADCLAVRPRTVGDDRDRHWSTDKKRATAPTAG